MESRALTAGAALDMGRPEGYAKGLLGLDRKSAERPPLVGQGSSWRDASLSRGSRQVGGDRYAVGGLEVDDKLGPRTVRRGSERRPLETRIEVNNGPEKFRSRTKEAGLTSQVGKGEIGVRKTEGGGDVRTGWGVPRVVEDRRGGGRRRADSPGPSRKGSGLISLLEEFASGKDNFDHDGLNGTGLHRSGLVSFPGKSRWMKQP